MDIKTAQASSYLRATAQPTSTNVGGTVTIGANATNINFTSTNVAYCVKATIATGTFSLVPTTGVTSGSTSWAAGTAQIATAQASGTITLAGNATITVTAAGMTGSPKAISVAVALSDTAATWAGKVRTALAADADVSALFTTGGTTTAISLTRKVNSLGILPANDGTLNIAIANGTCTGITAAPTSADTTAGVASTGVLIVDGDAKDFEGVAIPTITTVQGVEIVCLTGTPAYNANSAELGTMGAGETRNFADSSGLGATMAQTFNITGNNSQLTMTVFGISA